MRKYVVLVVLLITGCTMLLAQKPVTVTFYGFTNSESIDYYRLDTISNEAYLLHGSTIAIKLIVRADLGRDYKNGAFQIRAYYEKGKYHDDIKKNNYDIVYESDNFTVLLGDLTITEIPLSIQINRYPFAEIRCFFKNEDNIFEETDYIGRFPVVITNSKENYANHIKKLREDQEKERIKNSTINQQTIPDDRIKPPLGYASVVETLRIRETPSLQGKIVGSLKRFQTAEWLREESSTTDTVTVNGQPVEERWVKVRTLDGAVTGWVWKGFVRQVKKVIVKEMGLSFYEICDGVYNDDDLISKESVYYNETINSSGNYTIFGAYEGNLFTFDMPNEDLMQTIDNKEYIVNLVINETGKMEIPLFEGVLESYTDATIPLAVVCSYNYRSSQFSVFIVGRQHSITIRHSISADLIVSEWPQYFRGVKRMSKKEYDTLIASIGNEPDRQILQKYIKPDRTPANSITHGHKDFYRLLQVVWSNGGVFDWEGKSKFLSDLQNGVAPKELQRKYDDIMIIKNSIEKVSE